MLQKHEWLEAFSQGHGLRLYQFFGAHLTERDGAVGCLFRVWAPGAAGVSLVGEFNGWDIDSHPMTDIGHGVWERFAPGLKQYDIYKYAIHAADGRTLFKADPYAFHAETRPDTASKVYDLSGYVWGDDGWLADRRKKPIYHRPLNIYEVHLGSWRRTGDGEVLDYRTMAEYLVPYVKEMGYTHVELLPVTEHPLDDSWGYQCTGYFAVTSRFGTPHDFKYLVDQLHRAGIGVILDWVPAHFPKDAFGLYEFDGTPTYEYADPRKGEHADWGTRVFDYGKNEVRSFLFSSAMFWLEEFHIDGLRVDAVASMLYLDYGRQDGEWVANGLGGNENLDAVSFFQELNCHIFKDHSDVMMIAEESTAWPLVTAPVDAGGLGFNLKWNMGWMNDIQHYMKLDPYFRQHNHKDITFSFMYAFSENFLLPMSHDEVVHLKGSFLSKMPGDDALRLAGVRAFYAYMLTHPGKKLMFMGAEFGQISEWNFRQSLDWHLLEQTPHRQLSDYFKAINHFYLEQSPLWDLDFSWEGFQWLCADDYQGNCASFLRQDSAGKPLLVLCNFSPVHRPGYCVGVPFGGTFEEIFTTDAAEFGGGGRRNAGPIKSVPEHRHGYEQSIAVDLPPMSVILLRCVRRARTPGVKQAAEQKTVKLSSAKKAVPKKTASVKSTSTGKTPPAKKAVPAKLAAEQTDAPKQTTVKKKSTSAKSGAAQSKKTPKKPAGKAPKK